MTIALRDPPEFKRLVVIGGGIHIKDEVNVGSDEILHDSFSLQATHIGPENRQVSVPYIPKWGGEIRVQATFDLTWNADLSITVACNIKLYEGVSEDTNDLDSEREDIVAVGRDATDVPMPIFVRNDQEDDDDHVQLDVFISNFRRLLSNGRFRDACLNEHWFTSLAHARVVIEAWRREYNEERPKKGLGGLTPAAYAQQLTAKSKTAKVTP